jgi:hypothetical protein
MLSTNQGTIFCQWLLTNKVKPLIARRSHGEYLNNPRSHYKPHRKKVKRNGNNNVKEC